MLRTLSYKLEPYPALLFPGGEGMVFVPLDSAIHNYMLSELHGYKTGIGWEKIDEKEFMKPIPQQYLRNIIQHNKDLFEDHEAQTLEKAERNKNGLKARFSWVLSYLLRNQEKELPEVERSKSIDWFSAKLEAQGFEPDKIKLVKMQILSYPNDEKFEKLISDEEIISFSREAK